MAPARNAYQVATSASKIVIAAAVIVAGSDSASRVLLRHTSPFKIDPTVMHF